MAKTTTTMMMIQTQVDIGIPFVGYSRLYRGPSRTYNARDRDGSFVSRAGLSRSQVGFRR
jgi:hypothetical protein